MITNDDASGSDPTITLDEQNPVSEGGLVELRNRLATTITRELKERGEKVGNKDENKLKPLVMQIKLEKKTRFVR